MCRSTSPSLCFFPGANHGWRICYISSSCIKSGKFGDSDLLLLLDDDFAGVRALLASVGGTYDVDAAYGGPAAQFAAVQRVVAVADMIHRDLLWHDYA